MIENSERNFLGSGMSIETVQRREQRANVYSFGQAADLAGGEHRLRELIDWADTNLDPAMAESYKQRFSDPREVQSALEDLTLRREQMSKAAEIDQVAAAGGLRPEQVREAMNKARRGDVAARDAIRRTPMAIIEAGLN